MPLNYRNDNIVQNGLAHCCHFAVSRRILLLERRIYCKDFPLLRMYTLLESNNCT
jgi:hypothetical protein